MNGTHKARKPRRAAACRHGLLSLGLSLVAVQAAAFGTAPLKAEDAQGAINELVDILGHATPDSCRLEVLPLSVIRLSMEPRLKLSCPGKVLFIKHDRQSHADLFRGLSALLDRQLPADLAAAVLQPLAEFSVGEGRGYYTVYPWLEGFTLGDWLWSMSQLTLDTQWLKATYRATGALLGAVHRAGLVTQGRPLMDLRTRLVHEDVYDDNLMITPDHQVVLLDTDGFADPGSPQRVGEAVTRALLPLLVPEAVFRQKESLLAWLALLPDLVAMFREGYCEAFANDACQAVCLSELDELLGSHPEWETVTWLMGRAQSPAEADSQCPAD